MKLATSFVTLLAFASISFAQDSPNTASVVQVQKLTIVSADLPTSEQQRIIQLFQGRSYNADELRERVRQRLRDTGYVDPIVEGPQLTLVSDKESTRKADASLTVKAGDQCRLGEITFSGATVFPAERLRGLFPVTESLFNATAIGKGLESMMGLYVAEAYANFGFVPKSTLHSDRHVVDLTIDLDEGGVVSFGKLLLEGTEPRAGIAKALLASWSLKGKRYNPQLLKGWLAANSSEWPQGTAEGVHSEYVATNDPQVFDVLLHFQ
jgi:outer membrane translocation and assembly module TamA